MTIEEIKFNEKNMNFIINLSNEESLKISYEIYEEFQLEKDMEIDDLTYEKLKEEDSFIQAKEVGFKYASYMPRTIHEVRNKLYQKNISDKVAFKIIEYLEKQGYLNDENYANEYFRQCMELKNYSLKLTRLKFFQKGLSNELLEEIISRSYSEETEYSNALKQAEKKARNKDLNDFKEFQKVYRFLLSKGFSYEMSKNVLEDLKNEAD